MSDRNPRREAYWDLVIARAKRDHPDLWRAGVSEPALRKMATEHAIESLAREGIYEPG